MKTSSRFLLTAAAIAAAMGFAPLASCQTWKQGITINGVPFARARTTDTGLVIGYIDHDLTIAGRPCRQGWVHLFPNGIPAGFTSTAPIALGNFAIPPGTWVFQNRNGEITVCAFPHDVEIQGHICRGGIGGSEGVQTAFYPSGALKQFFARGDVVIDGVPCGSSAFRPGIELYEDGRLRGATLSKDFVFAGHQLSQGTRIKLTPAGTLALEDGRERN